jgi:oligopeptide/dipeptide ABC transporter ATP-binding protein
MYAGRIVEQGEVVDVFERSQHPYTRGLLRSVPNLSRERKSELPTIEGVVPSLIDPPAGCRFADRCWWRTERPAAEQQRCLDEDPLPRMVGTGGVACHFPLEASDR